MWRKSGCSARPPWTTRTMCLRAGIRSGVGVTPTSDTAYHLPVLAGEVVEMLRNAKSVLDGTLGDGGHAKALLDAGVERVVGVDRDPEALATARVRLEPFERAGRFRAVLSNYANLDDAVP